MKNKKGKDLVPLRNKLSQRLISRSDVPIIVYLTVIAAMVVMWLLRDISSDLTQDFFVELFGVAFTLFIIDVLLVRSKSKRWKIVRDDIDYLIARGVNRLRDGISTRVFNFDPDVSVTASADIRAQRNAFLTEISLMTPEAIEQQLNETELFSHQTYSYFNERASDFWDIINMKYAENLDPELVSQLINLHIYLKDLGAQINQYRKSERFIEDSDFYKNKAKNDMSAILKQVVELLQTLKEEGYSEGVRLTN
jgi:hypothetical protein